MRVSKRLIQGALLVLAWGLLVASAGCSPEDKRPPPYQPSLGGGSAESQGGTGSAIPDSTCEPIPEVDEGNACDSATVDLLQRKPTIYFVVDTSGSMSSRVVSGSESKIRAARSALTTMVEEVGHRINYGMASFPGPALDDDELSERGLLRGCEPGEEVFEVQEGDELTCLNRPAKGPVYRSFEEVVDKLRAEGGTPLAPTLDLIAPGILRREGKTTIILLTDGYPNCGVDPSCGPDLCSLTGASLVDETGYVWECNEDFNCCDEDLASDAFPAPSSYCIDGPDSVQQVEQLRNAGVDTYVIGILGEFDFDDVMNQLAEAGGQPRKGDRAYYDVDSLEELTDAVRTIGFKVAQSCAIELEDRPQDANTLNVYFDGKVVPFDPDDGWTISRDVVTLHGIACDEVTSGNVLQVKFISGCETIIR